MDGAFDDFDRRERLIRGWSDPLTTPRLLVPTDSHWRSADGLEAQTVMAWTGDAFAMSWPRRIHERVVGALGGDKGIWKRNSRLFLTAYASFFTRFEPAPILNAVTISPSRLRFRYWAGGGKYPLEQHLQPVFALGRDHKHISLAGLDGRIVLPSRGLEWSGMASRPHRVIWANRRRFRGKVFPEWRVFQANWEEDQATLSIGRLPQLDALIAAQANQRRAMTPMVHLWKVAADGQVEMLVLEVAGCGGLVSVRWSCQPFDCFMLAHRWYFEALRAAMSCKERMWRGMT